MTKPQLATGPQKCVVFGPVGDATQAETFWPSVSAPLPAAWLMAAAPLLGVLMGGLGATG